MTELVTNIYGHRQIHGPEDLGTFFPDKPNVTILSGSVLSAIGNVMTGILMAQGKFAVVTSGDQTTNSTGQSIPIYSSSPSDRTVKVTIYRDRCGSDLNIADCHSTDEIKDWSIRFNGTLHAINASHELHQTHNGERYVVAKVVHFNENRQMLLINTSNIEVMEVTCRSTTRIQVDTKVSRHKLNLPTTQKYILCHCSCAFMIVMIVWLYLYVMSRVFGMC